MSRCVEECFRYREGISLLQPFCWLPSKELLLTTGVGLGRPLKVLPARLAIFFRRRPRAFATKDGKLAIKLQIGEKRMGQIKNTFPGAGNQRGFHLNSGFSINCTLRQMHRMAHPPSFSRAPKLTRISFVL